MYTAPASLPIAEALEHFRGVSLAGMEQVSLQSRIDEKYIIPGSLLPECLALLQTDYAVLDIEGVRRFRYNTRYFDTPGFQLYLAHHNGNSRRVKVRFRCYEDSGLSFFEIKQKLRETLTVKIRATAPVAFELDAAQQLQAAECRGNDEALVYRLSNRFHRMTFCNAALTERLTIDTDISADAGARCVEWPGVVIIERKVAGGTPVPIPLLKPYLAVSGFSKYAIAAAQLYPGLKANNFKPAIRNLEKYAPRY